MVSPDFGEYCLPLVNGLQSHADVTLVLPHVELDPVRDRLLAGVAVIPFHKPRLRQPVRQLRMCRQVIRAVREAAPDIVHLQQGHFWLNLALRWLPRVPLVVTVHDHTPHLGDRGGRKTPQALMNIAFRRANRVIVHAERLKQELVERRGIPRGVIDVVPMIAFESPAPTEGTIDERDPSVVLFFGRMWPYKGLDVLIRAEPLVTARVPDVRFVIAGEGEDLAPYRERMVHPERFTVINRFVSIEERGELFAQASVVALPYLEASQSAVVPLAYAYGKPVVATTVGGLPEAVEHERTGLLVPPDDEGALAGGIIRLLQDRELRHELGERGRRKLLEEFSPSSVAARTLAVYEAALGTIDRSRAA